MAKGYFWKQTSLEKKNGEGCFVSRQAVPASKFVRTVANVSKPTLESLMMNEISMLFLCLVFGLKEIG
jgi:hypothetical protein